jgi:hypothetical protein
MNNPIVTAKRRNLTRSCHFPKENFRKADEFGEKEAYVL